MAARVGGHKIAYQPTAEPGTLQFFLDGKPSRLTRNGIDLDGSRVSSFAADQGTGLRIDYAHGPVVMVTPRFWTSQGVWYMNVGVFHSNATQGLIGPIPEGSWLPRLQNGRVLGERPQALIDRWRDLYQTFANSWRVTNKTSLFVYVSGTSTETFTDRNWPAPEPPCKLKPGLELPGGVELEGMPEAQAEAICQVVGDPELRRQCVFDVGTTGEEIFAQGLCLHRAVAGRRRCRCVSSRARRTRRACLW